MKPTPSVPLLALACFASVLAFAPGAGARAETTTSHAATFQAAMLQTAAPQTTPSPPSTLAPPAAQAQAQAQAAPPASTQSAPPAQEKAEAPEPEQDKPVEKRDKDAPVTVRGCLDNVMLMRVESEEEIPRLTPTLRLLSKKDVKKQLKAMNGYEVEVTGLLKLPPKSPLSRKIGNTTVSVGLGDPRAPQNQPMYQQRMEFGTLDVTAATNLGTRCSGRR